MKQDMRSVWDHSIAHRQEGMRFAEHDLITSGSLRFRSEKIRYPPSADLPDEEQAIANHEIANPRALQLRANVRRYVTPSQNRWRH
jgi:hypothetical protein